MPIEYPEFPDAESLAYLQAGKDTEKMELFLRELARTGVLSPALKAAGINRVTLNRWRTENGEFNALYTEAIQEATDMVELELRKRALHGITRKVLFKGMHVPMRDAEGEVMKDENGEVIWMTETVYSDKLIELYIKGNRQNYREKSSDTNIQLTGSPHVISGAKQDGLKITFVEPHPEGERLLEQGEGPGSEEEKEEIEDPELKEIFG